MLLSNALFREHPEYRYALLRQAEFCFLNLLTPPCLLSRSKAQNLYDWPPAHGVKRRITRQLSPPGERQMGRNLELPLFARHLQNVAAKWRAPVACCKDFRSG
jgi:hypothetical protein